MKLVLLRADCDVGRTCPNINLTERGSLAIQGYIVDPAVASDAGFEPPAPGQITVELPRSLVPELASADAWPALRLTTRGTVLVRGPELTDVEARAELATPPGEAVVELPVTAFPALEVAHAE